MLNHGFTHKVEDGFRLLGLRLDKVTLDLTKDHIDW